MTLQKMISSQGVNGMVSKTTIIAEAGVNHNGDISLAKDLIDLASEAGANLVKFQSFKAGELSTSHAKKANYQIASDKSKETQQQMLRRYELTEEMHHEIISHCEKNKIQFFSTAFDLPSLKFLISTGQDIFKVPSGEITNLPLLRYLGSLQSKIILSSGMANLSEVEAAIEIIEKAGTSRSDITLLHCTTEYPTPMAAVNLNVLQTMKRAFGVQVGLSDHTAGIEVSIGAVALGAQVIEKHFTIDRSLPGPDHKSSLEPKELFKMIESIRNIEVALGDGIKRPTEGEETNRLVVRKSIVAKCPIKRGEPFTDANLTTKRPGIGISPMRWDEIIGRTSDKEYKKDELIIV
jgi:N,N'-diacetyllegionaminate synthase